MERLAHEHKPKLIIAGASAYCAARSTSSASREIAEGRRRVLHGRHGALRRPDRRGRLPEPGAARRLRHLTTHKTLRGPRGGFILMKAEHEKAINSRDLPGHPGRPADARDRRQGGRVQGSAGARVQGLPAAGGRRTRACSPKTLHERGLRIVSRPHREPPDAGRPAREGHHRQGSRSRARRGAHHGQQERHPERSGEAVRHERRPPRHARDDHARLRREAKREIVGEPDRRRARQPGRRRRRIDRGAREGRRR